jgi:outer membrane protein, heavy metal efflux system
MNSTRARTWPSLLVFASMWLASHWASAQAAADAPSSEEAVFARWLRNSSEVAAWRTQIGAARFDVVTAGLWRNPELTLSANALVGGTPPDGQSGQQAQLTLALPIFGQVSARKAAAEALVSVAEVNVAATVWARATEIENAMVDRAFADARLSMLNVNLTELDEIERVVAARRAAGANSQYDVLRVSTSTSTLRAAVTNATIERDQAEATILGLVADPTLKSAPVTREGVAAFRGPEDEAALVDLALRRRPDLELARRGITAAEASASRYRREAIPTPSVFVAGYLVQKEYGVQLTGGVSFPLPVFDRNQGLVGRALEEARGQQDLAHALETRVRAEVSGSWRARQHARDALDQFRRRTLPAATELLKRAEVTYQAGTFSIAELFDAYQTMWDARLQELDLERRKAMAEAALERAAVLLPLALPSFDRR